MIMVDVMVPSVGRQYNFSLEENEPVFMLIAEMTELICQKESCRLTGAMEGLVLCSREIKQILSPEATLHQNGITGGSQLILV